MKRYHHEVLLRGGSLDDSEHLKRVCPKHLRLQSGDRGRAYHLICDSENFSDFDMFISFLIPKDVIRWLDGYAAWEGGFLRQTTLLLSC